MPLRTSPQAIQETQYVSQSDDSQNLWEAEQILDERGPKVTGDYLIRWAGIDTVTKRAYEPSWERKTGCSDDLIKEWKEMKDTNPTIVGKAGMELQKKRSEGHKRKIVGKEEEWPVKKPKVNAAKGASKPETTARNIPYLRSTRSRTVESSSAAASAEPSNSVGSSSPDRVTRGAPKRPVPIRTRNTRSTSKIGSSPSHPIHTGTKQVMEVVLSPKKLLKKRVRIQEQTSDLATAAMAPSESTPAPREIVTRTSESPAEPETPSPTKVTDSRRSTRLQPVPQPSPSIFRTVHQAGVDDSTQKSRSVPISQIDPITDFSSPARPGTQKGVPAPEVMEISVKDELEEEDGDSIPPRTVRRIIDGEEVIVILSDDEADSDGEMIVGQGANMPLDDIDLEELAEEPSGDFETAGNAAVTPHSPVPDKGLLSDREEPTTVSTSLSNAETTEQAAARAQALIEEKNLLISTLQTQITEKDSLALRLQSQLDEAQLLNRPVQDEATRLKTLQDQVDTQASLVSDLEARLARANASAKSLAENRDYVKGLYDVASNRAVEEVGRAKVLDAQVHTLRGQLTLGLKQKELHHEAVKAKRDAEIERLRMENKVLLDQARLTDDKIRARAQAYPRLKKEHEEMQEAAYGTDRKLEELRKRNHDLVEQIEVLRARQMGVFGDDEASEYGYRSATPRSSPELDMAGMGYNTRPPGMTSSGNIYTSSQVMPDEADLGDATGEVQETTDWSGSMYACKVREGPSQCEAYFETKEELSEHFSMHDTTRTGV